MLKPIIIVNGYREVFSSEAVIERFPEGDDLKHLKLRLEFLCPREFDILGVRLDATVPVERTKVGALSLWRCLGMQLSWHRRDDDEIISPWRWPLYALPSYELKGPAKPISECGFPRVMPLALNPVRMRSREVLIVELVVLDLPAMWEINKFPVTLRFCVEGVEYR